RIRLLTASPSRISLLASPTSSVSSSLSSETTSSFSLARLTQTASSCRNCRLRPRLQRPRQWTTSAAAVRAYGASTTPFLLRYSDRGTLDLMSAAPPRTRDEHPFIENFCRARKPNLRDRIVSRGGSSSGVNECEYSQGSSGPRQPSLSPPPFWP